MFVPKARDGGNDRIVAMTPKEVVGLPTESVVKHQEWSPGWDALAHSVPLPLPVFNPTSKVKFRLISSSTIFLPTRWEIFLPLNISSSDLELERWFLIAGLYASGDLWQCLDTFFFNLFFNWRKFALQCWFLLYNAKQSKLYIYVSLPLEPPSTPRISPRSSQSTRLDSLCYTAVPTSYLFYTDSVYMSTLLSRFTPPSPSPTLTTSPSSTSLSPFFPWI